MCSTNTGTRKHCNGCFHNHRQINIDAITFLNAKTLQHVGKLLHFIKKLRISHCARVARFTFKMNGNFVAFAREHMAIKTVVGDIQLATYKPLAEGKLPFADGIPWLLPGDKFICLSGPKSFVIFIGLVIEMGTHNQRILFE